MRRKLYEKLVRWKNMTNDRLPMLLYGARQVGKTYVMQELGAECFKKQYM